MKNIYEKHHKENRSGGFSILKEERGKIISNTIGVGKTVLDLGCRDGALTKYFTLDNKVLAVDVDKDSMNKVSGAETLEVDLNGSWKEIGSRKFDAVVAGEILEHLYFPSKIISQVKERLNPEGLFICSVPNAFSLKNRFRLFLGKKKNTSLNDPTHINHFSKDELMNLLKKEFTSVEYVPLGNGAWIDRFIPGLFSYDMLFISKN